MMKLDYILSSLFFQIFDIRQCVRYISFRMQIMIIIGVWAVTLGSETGF